MLEKIEPMEFIEDDEIIRLFHERKREQEAFRLLVNKYKERLYWHIRKIVINHDDTDDLLQNVFVKIWQGLQEFRNDSKLYTWMYRIATNESLNFLNEKSRKVYGNSDEISVYLENTLESDTYFSGDKIQKELQRAILTLSERQRLIFNMKYFDELTGRITGRIEKQKEVKKSSSLRGLKPYMGLVAIFFLALMVVQILFPGAKNTDLPDIEGENAIVQEMEAEDIFDSQFNPTNEEIIEYLASEVDNYEMILAGIY